MVILKAMKKIYTSMLVAFSLSLGMLSQNVWADAGATLGGSEKREAYGSSQLLNALLAAQGKIWTTEEPIPKVYRDEEKENEIDRDKARAYALQLIKENKNNCVKDTYTEGLISYNALFLSIEIGDIELTKLLIQKGCSLNNEIICNTPSFFNKRVKDNKNPKVQEAYSILKKHQSK